MGLGGVGRGEDALRKGRIELAIRVRRDGAQRREERVWPCRARAAGAEDEGGLLVPRECLEVRAGDSVAPCEEVEAVGGVSFPCT